MIGFLLIPFRSSASPTTLWLAKTETQGVPVMTSILINFFLYRLPPLSSSFVFPLLPDLLSLHDLGCP